MARLNLDQFDSKQISLVFKFPFHQKRMNEAKNKQIILDTLASFGVTGYELTCALLPKNAVEEVSEATLEPFVYETPPEQDNIVLSQIRSVFGGAEVLE
jgi:hypothetical protein